MLNDCRFSSSSRFFHYQDVCRYVGADAFTLWDVRYGGGRGRNVRVRQCVFTTSGVVLV